MPTSFDVNLDTELAINDRLDRRLAELQRAIEQGAEVGPETRALIDRLNDTLRQIGENGLQADGTIIVDDATLQRVDTLLSIIEDDLGIQVEAGLDQPTIDMVNRLADSIDAAPSNWEAAATDVIRTLEGSTSAIAKEVANEIRVVIDKAKTDSLQLSAALGSEARCNVDFMGARVEGSITEFVGRSIIGQIRAVVTGEAAPTAIKTAKVCQIIPDQIDLIRSGDQLVYNADPVKVSGYDLTEGNLPQAFITDEIGQRIGSIQLFPLRTSDYQLQLNLQGLDFSLLPERARIVFEWANGLGGAQSRSEIALMMPTQPTPSPTLVPQAQLTIGTQTINVRKGPGTAYDAVGLAESGATFIVLGSNSDRSWWQIQYGNNLGWVFNNLVTRNEIDVPIVGSVPLPPTSTFTPVPPATATNVPQPTATSTETPRPADTATNTPVPPTVTPTFTPTPTETRVERHLLMNGTVKIRDDENFGGDEHSQDTVGVAIVLTPPEINKSYFDSWCAGDEVRGELHLQLALIDAGTIRVSGRALYFEGTNCNTSDLEKTFDISAFDIPANQERPLDIRLADGDGDVNFNLTLRNASP